MKKYLDENFLIYNKTGTILFHEVAAPLPFIDYHNHIDARFLAQNQPFSDLTSLWIKDDPYKHRAMRVYGVPEKIIQGQCSPRETYVHWVKVLYHAVGNPLYHWSSLELKRVFGIDEVLSPDNAHVIWDRVNRLLSEPNYRPLEIVTRWRPKMLVTSNDLLESFESHATVNHQQNSFSILPSLRGDSILAMKEPQRNELSLQTHTEIKDLQSYLAAIEFRLDKLVEAGVRIADHALDDDFGFPLPSEQVATQLFDRQLHQANLSAYENSQLTAFLLFWLGKAYARRGWVLQLHMGAQRFTSTRLRNVAGAYGGYACIGQPFNTASLIAFLDALEREALLPRIILYPLNPADFAACASITGSFTGEHISSKVQLGPAWWFNDHYEGISQQLTLLATYGFLSPFIGMTTDSRSILSFSRHEYFRRILCDLLGQWVEMGRMPNDRPLLRKLVADICYYNSKKWFFSDRT